MDLKAERRGQTEGDRVPSEGEVGWLVRGDSVLPHLKGCEGVEHLVFEEEPQPLPLPLALLPPLQAATHGGALHGQRHLGEGCSTRTRVSVLLHMRAQGFQNRNNNKEKLYLQHLKTDQHAILQRKRGNGVSP